MGEYLKIDIRGGRITFIDALRAVTLLGIILLHTGSLFGFYGDSFDDSYFSSFGRMVNNAFSLLLSGRCKLIFGMLFGVSFYLILRNPQNSPSRFIWRCFLLFVIGVLNKSFYARDVLMLYGLSGMLLVPFRNCSVKKLVFITIALFFVNECVFDLFDVKHWLFPNIVLESGRFFEGCSLVDVLRFPAYSSAMASFMSFLSHPFTYLVQFLLGYIFAKSGIIESVEKYAKLKIVFFFAMIYAVLGLCFILLKNELFHDLGNYAGALFYAVAFLYLYYKCFPLFRCLEPYGKLGLTNYSCQGIFGVTLMICVFFPLKLSIEWCFLGMFVFFILQCVFSTYWLKYFKYGPFEWVWRCATNCKYISNRIAK